MKMNLVNDDDSHVLQNPEAPGMHNTPSMYGGGSSRSDSHTRVSYKRNAGYFERVGGSCCGAFVGIFILLAGFPLLFWNEVCEVIFCSLVNSEIRHSCKGYAVYNTKGYNTKGYNT